MFSEILLEGDSDFSYLGVFPWVLCIQLADEQRESIGQVTRDISWPCLVVAQVTLTHILLVKTQSHDHNLIQLREIHCDQEEEMEKVTYSLSVLHTCSNHR